jgi:hypothetical protein
MNMSIYIYIHINIPFNSMKIHEHIPFNLNPRYRKYIYIPVNSIRSLNESTLYIYIHSIQIYSGRWFQTFFTFPYSGNVVIPTDQYFSEG